VDWGGVGDFWFVSGNVKKFSNYFPLQFLGYLRKIVKSQIIVKSIHEIVGRSKNIQMIKLVFLLFTKKALMDFRSTALKRN